MNKKLSNNKLAFTLVETLVVITIVGVLTSLSMVAIQNSRENARNAKRIADVKQMQIALELYYQDNGSYPSSLNPGESLASNSIVYMETIPFAPTPNDGTCSEGENTYTYLNPYRLNYFYIEYEPEQWTYHNWDYERNYYDIHFCLGEESGGLLAGEVVASPRGLNNWTCGDLLLDYRDGQYYETVEIGDQCWMAENMRYDNGCISKTYSSSVDVGRCGIYGELETMNNYGKLYQWSAAMNSSTEELSQGICPDGWHIPSLTDWQIATSTINSNPNYLCNGGDAKAFASNFGFHATTTECLAGNNLDLNNSTRFNIFPLGLRNSSTGNYANYTWRAYFWTSTIGWVESQQGYYPVYISLADNKISLSASKTPYSNGFSVRCIKDNQ